VLEKLAAAQQLGARGLVARLTWRLRQASRVLAFLLWRRRQDGRFAVAAVKDFERMPIRSYLPSLADVRARYDDAPDRQSVRDSVERIRSAAERIRANKVSIRGTGELALNFEDKNWYAYDRGDAIMLNRHDFLLPLVQAHVLGQDPHAADKVRELFAYWIENFDLSRLRQCDTPIDAAIRLLNWAWVFNSGILRPGEGSRAKLLAIVWLQVEYIYAWHSAGGNHLVLEALAVYVYGLMFPGGRAGRWSAWGKSTLLEQLMRQTTADGVHTEQSMFYHQAVATHYLKFFLAADLANDRIDARFRERFGLMLDYVHDTAKPSRRHPVLGDGEPLVTDDREHWEARALLAARYVMFGKPVSDALVPMIDDSSVWLLLRWAGEIENAPQSQRSILYGDAGIAVLRGDRSYVLMDAAPFSDPEFPHHGHADALSVEVCVGRDDLFVDPGGYGYYDDDFRRFFRSTAAHNTVTLDGRDQSEVFGVLGYGRLCKARLVRYETGEDFDSVVATHDGYCPALHQRSVILIKKPRQCLVIADWIERLQGGAVSSRLHAAPGCRIDLDTMRIRPADGDRAYALALDGSAAVTQRTVCGEKTPALQGWFSPETHVAVPAETWEATLDEVASCALVTLIALEPGLPVAARVRDLDHADLEIGSSRYGLVRQESGYFLELR
jgi:hypothetical protein